MVRGGAGAGYIGFNEYDVSGRLVLMLRWGGGQILRPFLCLIS